MDFVVAAYFVAGLVLLLAGAESLVRGASRLAAAIGVSPLVIGLTVVAWGTGSPELAVGVKAALAGQPDLTIGNVVGSNIANVLLILGLAAAVAPLTVSSRIIRLEVPLMIGVSVAAYLFALDGVLGPLDGVIMVVGIVAYTGWSVHESRGARRKFRAAYEEEFGGPPPTGWGPILLQIVYVTVGLAMLVKGSDWLVLGASAIARALGFSELVIGLTIVAIGTSLPEVATSAVAAWRGQRDIAVGNAVGSNMFNILAVLGTTSIIAGGGIQVSSAALRLDMPVMIAVAAACLPIFFAGNRLSRWEGALFLAIYACYLAFLVYDATENSALRAFNSMVLVFVLPITVITLIAITIQELRQRRRSESSRATDG